VICAESNLKDIFNCALKDCRLKLYKKNVSQDSTDEVLTVLQYGE